MSIASTLELGDFNLFESNSVLGPASDGGNTFGGVLFVRSDSNALRGNSNTFKDNTVQDRGGSTTILLRYIWEF